MVKIGATGVLAVVGVGVAAYLGWKVYQGAGSVAQAVGDALKTDLNPTNSGNIVNRGFETVQQAATGEASFSDWLLKTFNPGAASAFENKPTPFVRRDPAADAADETARLLARYPSDPAQASNRDPSSIFGGGASFADGAGLGSGGFGSLWTGGNFFTGIPTL